MHCRQRHIVDMRRCSVAKTRRKAAGRLFGGPLQAAVSEGQYQIVRVLLKHRLDITVTQEDTALQCRRQC
jgi:hypothetical protein